MAGLRTPIQKQFKFLLGEGSYGKVYQAAGGESPDAADVAVKVIDLGNGSASAVDEIRALTDLDHPNIVKVLDVSFAGGSAYVIMELLRGRTLARTMDGHGVALAEAIEVISQLCEALDHAHGKGILHCDLSPRNVFVCEPSGAVKLLDFGVARSDSGPAHHSGTPAYMAPERFSAEQLTAGADLFSVGCILHELTVGAAPACAVVTARDGQTSVQRAPFDPQHYPVATLRAIVARLLEPNPAQRYQSARALADDLARAREAVRSGDTRTIEPQGWARLPLKALARSVFIGREAAMRTAANALTAAADGQAQTVLVAGAAGSGKTRLISQLARTCAQRGFLVLHGGGLDVSRSLPFAALREALESIRTSIEHLPTTTRDGYQARFERTLAKHTSALATVAPKLAISRERDSAIADEEAAQRQFIGDLAAFVSELGDAGLPVVLWLDDLQWVDSSTQRVLTRLSALKDAHVLLVLASRIENGPLPAWLDEAAKNSAVSRLDLDGLGVPEISELLRKLVPECEQAEFASRLIYDVSLGNTLLVWECFHQLESAGAFNAGGRAGAFDDAAAKRAMLGLTPRALLNRRLEALAPLTQAELSLAAVWGRRFSVEESAISASTLSDAVANGVLMRDPEGVCVFTHDRLREACLMQLSANDVRASHARIAAILEARGGFAVATAVEHYTAAGELASAQRVALRAAENAEQVYALDSACEFYVRALRWAEQNAETEDTHELQELRLKVGQTAQLIGSHAIAVSALGSWLAHDAATRGIARARVLGLLAEAQFRGGAMEEGVRTHELALAALGVSVPRKLGVVVGLLAQFVVACVYAVFRRALPLRTSPEHEEVVARLRSFAFALYYVDSYRCLLAHMMAVNRAETLPASREKIRVFGQHGGLGLVMPLFSKRFLRYGTQASEMARQIGDPWSELYGRAYTIMGHFAQAQWGALEGEIAAANALGRRVKDPLLLGMARQQETYMNVRRGRLRHAIECARQLRAAYELVADPVGSRDACFYLPQCLVDIGMFSEASAIAEWMIEGGRRHAVKQTEIEGLGQLAYVCWAAEAHDKAREHAEHALALSRKFNVRNVHVAQTAARVLLIAAAQKSKVSMTVLIENAMSANASPGTRAFSAWALGTYWQSQGKRKRASSVWRKGLLAARAHDNKLDEARLLAALGESSLQAGNASEYQQALALFDACGAIRESAALRRSWQNLSPATLPHATELVAEDETAQ